MATEEPISLATANTINGDTVIGIAGGTLDINENARTGLFSTAGSTSYTYRGDLGDFTMASDQNKGDIVFSYALTPWNSYDSVLTSLAERFIYYNISSVAITFKCIAPWSTASGSMQFFYNPDPENPPSPTPEDALAQAMRLLQSKQLSSKGEGSVTCNIGSEQASQVFKGWRYCKPAKNSMPRTESFGYIGGVVRGVPSIGDGTQWTATIITTFNFKDATKNVSASEFEIVVSDTISNVEIVGAADGSGLIYAKVSVPTTGVTFAGTFAPYNVDNFYLTLTETQDAETLTERYNYTNNNAFCIDDGTTLDVWLRTTFTPTRTALDDPETSAISTDIVVLMGSATYVEDVLGPSSTKYQFAPKQSNASFLTALRSQRVVDRRLLLNKHKHLLTRNHNLNK